MRILPGMAPPPPPLLLAAALPVQPVHGAPPVEQAALEAHTGQGPHAVTRRLRHSALDARRTEGEAE